MTNLQRAVRFLRNARAAARNGHNWEAVIRFADANFNLGMATELRHGKWIVNAFDNVLVEVLANIPRNRATVAAALAAAEGGQT